VLRLFLLAGAEQRGACVESWCVCWWTWVGTVGCV